jgi:hypothetical protein
LTSNNLPTSPCELSEREVTSSSNLKVVGALDNYSLVFVIFINFFGQLKDWVGQVLFSVSCLKGQVEKYANVEAWAKVDTSCKLIHDFSHSWLGTDTSVKSDSVKLVLWAQTSLLNVMMWSYKWFLHVREMPTLHI